MGMTVLDRRKWRAPSSVDKDVEGELRAGMRHGDLVGNRSSSREIEIEIVTSKKYKYSRDVRLRTPQRTQKLAVVTIDKHKKYPVLVVIPPVTD